MLGVMQLSHNIHSIKLLVHVLVSSPAGVFLTHTARIGN